MLAATAPRFEARFALSGADAKSAPPFAPESPAGRLWATLGARTAGWSAEWQDPHAGEGGLGASTAQFAAVLAFGRELGGGDFALDASADWTKLLEIYRSCAKSGEGVAPSGADLVAQASGGLCAFDGRTGKARVFAWPFADLDFTLLRTGAKLATHEHLQSADRSRWPIGDLRALAEQTIAAVEGGHARAFARAVDAYGASLAAADLCAERTAQLLASARRQLGEAVAAAKGCGAMGADIALILHAPDAKAAVEQWAKRESLAIAGRSADLSDGLRTVR